MGLRFELFDGRLTFKASDAAVHLRGARPSLVYWTGGQRHVWRPLLQETAGGAEAVDAQRGLHLSLRVAAEADALTVHLSLRNIGSVPIRIDHLAPLWLGDRAHCDIGPDAAAWGVLRNGYQSWTGTRSFRSNEIDLDPWSYLLKVGLIDVRNPSTQQPGHFRCDLFAGIEHLKSRDALVLGFLDGRYAFAGIEVGIDANVCTELTANVDYDEIELAPGAAIDTPPLWISAGTNAPVLLEAYAAASGAAMQARFPERNPKGWCSWYYYFTRIDESCILENLRAVTAMRDEFACDYFQIDDGYQAAIGDWLTPNEKFPRGMAYLSEQIRAAGMEAGIWSAPFIARSNSQLFREHPDWFVRSERGGARFALWNPLWGFGGCYALDTTHPEVLEWLAGIYRTLVHEWGYRVLKLDFLYAAALPGLRHDRHATRAEALRRGLAAIRAAAGEDAFLIGCGCPLGPAVGTVDAMRIGPDVAPFWSNFTSRGVLRDQHGLATKHAIRNSLARAFLHRRWWLNDPDCLMVRDTRTQLSAEEVRTLATAIAVTDGMIVLSDRMNELSPRARDVLQHTLHLAGGAARVIDVFETDPPEVVVNQSPQRTMIAVFNLHDEPRRKTVDLRRIGLRAAELPYTQDYWTGISIPIADGVANFGTLPPHSCRVLVLPPNV